MIRNQKSFKSKNMQLFVLALSVLAVLLTQQVHQVYASNLWDDAYNAGKNDRMDGNEKNDTCPPDASEHGRCAIYKAGYAAGYAAEGFFHGDDEERSTPQDYCNRDDPDDEDC